MVVSTEIAIAGPYDGNDVTVTFDYDFYIAVDAELLVTLADSDGVETVQELDVDYTVTGAGDPENPGGTFVMTVAPATGETVVGTLDIEFKQDTNFLNLGGFFTEMHETAVDKLTRLAQQLKEGFGRCLKVGPTSDTDPEDLALGTFAGSAPIDDSGFSSVLSGVSPATVQGCLDQIDTDAATAAGLTALEGEVDARAPLLIGYASEAFPGSAIAEIELGDIDVVIPADYETLLIEFKGGSPSVGGEELRMQVGGGGAWIETEVYSWINHRVIYAAAPVDEMVSGGSIEFYGGLANDVSDSYGVYVTLRIARASHSGLQPQWHGQATYSSDTAGQGFCSSRLGGKVAHAVDVCAVRLYYGSGNIEDPYEAVMWALPKGW